MRHGAAAAALLFLAGGCGGESGSGNDDGPAQPTWGDLAITVTTTGQDHDLDGYEITVGTRTERVALNGGFTFTPPAGTALVQVGDVAGNCGVAPSSEVSASVVAGKTTQVALQVQCDPIEPLKSGEIVVAVAGWSGNSDEIGLFVVSPDDGSRRQLTQPPRSTGAWDNHPHVSPDGKRIVFVRHDATTEDGSLVRIVNADGTVEPGYVARGENPRWSPDGGRIVLFQGDEQGGLPDLWVMRPDGSQALNITNAPEAPDINPDWHPDGSRIAFRSIRVAGESGNLYSVASTGGPLTALTQPGNGGNFNPRWSPDGTRMAFQSDRTGAWRVFVMDADGSNVQQVTADVEGQDDFVHAWSSDGTRLLFKRTYPAAVRDETTDPEMFIVEVATGVETRLTDNGMDDHAAAWHWR